MPFAHAVLPADHAMEVDLRIRRLNITKKELAEMLNLNYSIVCNTIRGHLNRPDVERLVSAKLDELERSGE